MNKIIITGFVGKDPEIRTSATGSEFAIFSVAVNVGKDKTEWYDIICGDKKVDIVRNYVRKGSRLLIEGTPSVNAYINKENKAVGSIKISAHILELLDKKESNNEQHYDLSQSIKSDEIPF